MDKLVSYFQNMKTEEMVLFITIVVCIITLIVMSISLASKNAELRKIINKMDEETFEIYYKYHLSICEREELLGASSHVLDILKK